MTAAESSTTNPAAGHPASGRSPAPHEAKGWFPHLTDEGADALRDVMTAVNGFYYPGDRSDAIASALAWLQEHPQACAALGLGLAGADVPQSAEPLGEPTGAPTGETSEADLRLVAAEVLSRFASPGEDTPGFAALLDEFPDLPSRGNLKVLLWRVAGALREHDLPTSLPSR